ncbi:hypothetical protein C8R44DRAFT_783676 [Mycena epipterygia]|nr:hypothetical protein C8R44DRAFT_783676 [Mycena epipterygia]
MSSLSSPSLGTSLLSVVFIASRILATRVAMSWLAAPASPGESDAREVVAVLRARVRSGAFGGDDRVCEGNNR